MRIVHLVCNPQAGSWLVARVPAGGVWLSRGTETLGHGVVDLDLGRALAKVDLSRGDSLDDRSDDCRPIQTLPFFAAAARRSHR
jgi:hypothetical protein